MEFILSNKHRKYLGLSLINDNYNQVTLTDNYQTKYLYFANNIIKKVIIIDSHSYYEYDTNYETSNDHTLVLPQKFKLTCSSVTKLKGKGMYFFCQYKTNEDDSSHLMIGNYNNEQSYYDSFNDNIKNSSELNSWCDKWVLESTEEDLNNIKEFTKAPKKHLKYQEGDYFVFKLNRHEYGFGKILLDINRLRREYQNNLPAELPGFDLAGKPLLVSVFKVIKDTPIATITELEAQGSLPSEYIFDDKIYYDEWPIIAHQELKKDEIDYPITCAKCVVHDKQKLTIYLQRGFSVKTKSFMIKDIENNNLTENDKKILSAIGFGPSLGFYLNIQRFYPEIKKCIAHHQEYYQKDDLRSPLNSQLKEFIYKYFNE